MATQAQLSTATAPFLPISFNILKIILGAFLELYPIARDFYV